MAGRPRIPAERHNAVLRAAHSRIDGGLEKRLAGIVQPILEQAGARAAAAFQRKATNHLTAALRRQADRDALARVEPGQIDGGFFGFRLRPVTLNLTAAVSPTSAMVCVKPRPAEAAAIAEPGKEDPETLHVTLVYLGSVEDAADLDRIAAALRPVAASHAPLDGVVGGYGRFQPPGVGILLPDVPGLVELRVAVTEALVAADLDYARNHGFEAHITIDAEPDPDELDRALLRTAQRPLHFDSLLIVQGDEVAFELPLTGALPLTAAGTPGTPPDWTAPAGDEIVNVDDLVSTLRTKTDPVRRAFVEATMTPILKDAGLSFDVTNPLTAKVLSQAGSQIRSIAATTQLNVMRIVGRSYDQGLSIPDTAKAIRAGMSSASVYRSTMIARTELAGAANGGSLAASQLAASVTGLTLYKEWLTAPGAPHPRHEEYDGLDGQTVSLDAPFDVGGDALQFPGDPDGSPEETINCRCSLAYTEEPPADWAGGPSAPADSTSGTDGLDAMVPEAGPVEDTVSVGAAAPVPLSLVARIKAWGLDKSLRDIRPTTAVGKRVFAHGLGTDKLYEISPGHWRDARKDIHSSISYRVFDGHVPPEAGVQKEATLTAGGSASGKGGTMVTIGDRTFPLSDLEKDIERVANGEAAKYPDIILINSDIFKSMLPEFQKLANAGDFYAAGGVHEESSYIAKMIETQARARGFHVVFDGTGAGSSFLGRAESLARDGYDVHAKMVSIPTNDAIVRAMDRGDKSGRYVAIQAIKDAHKGASAQFPIWSASSAIKDWQLWDNSVEGAPRVLVAERKAGGTIQIYDAKKYDEILAKANEGGSGAAAAPASVATITPTPLSEVPSLIPGPSEQTIAKVEQFQQRAFDGWAANYPADEFGQTVNEIRSGYRARVDSLIADEVANAEARIRLEARTLPSILRDGRFKTQFETDSSAGALDPQLRAQTEKKMFGYPESLAPELRPIYGYLSSLTNEEGPVEQYGSTIIRLGDAARNRATFTLTDSLGAGSREEIVPVPVSAPANASRAVPTAYRANADPLAAPTPTALTEAYAEAQIHGGLTVADIKEVIIPRFDISWSLSNLSDAVDIGVRRVGNLRRDIATTPSDATATLEELRANLAAQEQRLAQDEADLALFQNDAAGLRRKLDEMGIASRVVDSAAAELAAP